MVDNAYNKVSIMATLYVKYLEIQTTSLNNLMDRPPSV